ncbi:MULTISPECIES: hypothetical protein [unclassified Burkholderia]|uniref:hypothetical protein n=1 Tax=unclassified Burkholderia TaxID=2613784 RepID=UPI002AB01FC1|nr:MULTISPECIES: hypothetical protein [unclassified Burkholderia]
MQTDLTNVTDLTGLPIDPEGLARIELVIRLLQGHQFDLSTEKHLQSQVEVLLTEHGLTFEREKRLTALDIPDFLLAGGIVLECKLRNKASKMDIYRQLERYSKHDEVKGLVLATNGAMGLPLEIGGKPAWFASFSRGWM